MNLPIALQLYSVRDEMEKDFAGTLKKIAEMGYKGVEFAGFGKNSAAQVKNLLDELGLAAVGSHTSLDLLTEKTDEVIEYNLKIDNKYIICPYNKYESKQDVINASKTYDEIGEKLNAKGLQFLYHNHDFEFKKYDEEYAIDIIFKGVKPENMAAEIDSGWVFFAGINPADYVRSYKGKCPLVHIKDFTANKDFTEIGRGVVNIKEIAAASVEAGTKWLIVEQDKSSIPTLESVRISFENLKKIGIV